MAYHPYSGPLRNPFNNAPNDDDEFGDFTSATAFNTPGNYSNGIQHTTLVAPVIPVVPVAQNGGVFFNPIPDGTSDDEFGDFCGPSMPVQSLAPPLAPPPKALSEQQLQIKPVQPPLKCQPNYDIDLEIDLETVTHLPWNGTSKIETGIQNLNIVEEPNLFDSIEPISCAPVASTELVNALEDVFTLDCQIEAPVLQPFADLDHVADTFTDDEFGDFAQADVSPTQEGISTSLTTNLEDVPPDAVSTPQETPPALDESKEPPKLLNDPIVSSITVPEATDDAFDCENSDPAFTSFSELTTEPVSICWDDPLPPLDIVDPVVVPVIADETEAVPAEDLSQIAIAGEKPKNVEFTQPSDSCEEAVEPDEYPEEQDDDDDDDFGDFADFQEAVRNHTLEDGQSGGNPVESSFVKEVDDDDDFGDFDDFTAAPPIANESVPNAEQLLTPERQIQKMLSSVFPLETDASAESRANHTSESPSGALWSYVSQVDSTPALSFSWKHSSAQQRFLQALRIDTILQLQNKKPVMDRWTPPSNHKPPSLTPKCETPSERGNITLDLDFFMAAGTPSSAPNSLLESIERELLASPTTASPQQPPAQAMVRPNFNESELSEFFDHLQLEPGPSAPSQAVIDLLQ